MLNGMSELPKVYLIGGAPGVGKSTLGRELATRIGQTSLSADDLLVAAKGVTTAQSHPGLHVMSRLPYPEYFATSSVEQLKADATIQHDAMWPAIESVVRAHSKSGPPIVIDGWFMRPNRVAALDLANVRSLWLVAAPGVLAEREALNVEFWGRSSDPTRMRANFVARSLWYNDLIQREATTLGLRVLVQNGQASPSELCTCALANQDG
jgi:2-phosphoglycerate kinase